MTQKNIGQYSSVGDSKSLTNIDGQKFTIVAIEPSAYNDQPGYKITTKESFKVEGEDWNKFHTTRHAVVSMLNKPELQADLAKGDTIGPVVCKKTKAKTKGVPDYWVMEEA